MNGKKDSCLQPLLAFILDDYSPEETVLNKFN